MFGQLSEKQKYVSPDQLCVFNEAEAEQDPKAPEPDEKTIIVPEHKPKRSLEDRIKELPSEDVFLELEGEEAICAHCGTPLRKMGKKFLRSELEVIKKCIKVINYYTYTYTCDRCEKKESVSSIYGFQAPELLIKRSYASPSLVADVMTQKYVDGVPLARKEKICCATASICRERRWRTG